MDFIRLAVLTTRRKSCKEDFVNELNEKRLTNDKMYDKTDGKSLMTLQKQHDRKERGFL